MRSLRGEEPMEVLPARGPLPAAEVLPAPLPLADVLPARAPLPPAEVTPLVKPARQVEAVATVLPAPLPRRSVAGPYPGERRSSVLDELIGAWRLIEAVLEFIIGAVVLFVALPVLAALPILQFLTLGFLLEAGGRIGRSSVLDGCKGLFAACRIVSRAGTIIFCTWLFLWPLRLVSSLAISAEIIDPGGSVARNWKIALVVLTILVLVHVSVACACGGKLRYFLLPFINPFVLIYKLWKGNYYALARDGVWEYVVSLRLPYFFWLGCRGFAGGFIWLVIPVSMLAVSRYFAPFGFVGAFLLIGVVLLVPFLQMHMAAENRFLAVFDVFSVLKYFARSPLRFAFSFVFLLLPALPLYLLKIETVPREVAWLPGLFFIVFSFPSRILTGWAYGRAAHRQKPQMFIFRWLAIVIAVPIMLLTSSFYVLILFLSQYTSWDGVWSLYDQHAFLLPAPFLWIWLSLTPLTLLILTLIWALRKAWCPQHG